MKSTLPFIVMLCLSLHSAGDELSIDLIQKHADIICDRTYVRVVASSESDKIDTNSSAIIKLNGNKFNFNMLEPTNIEVKSNGQQVMVHSKTMGRYVVENSNIGLPFLSSYKTIENMIGVFGDHNGFIFNIMDDDGCKSIVKSIITGRYIKDVEIDGADVSLCAYKTTFGDVNLWFSKESNKLVVAKIRHNDRKNGFVVTTYRIGYGNANKVAFDEDFVLNKPDGARKCPDLLAKTPHPSIGKSAPLDFTDEHGRLIKNYVGKKIIVLDFWASWCKPCIKNLPHVVEVTNSFGNDVVMLAVNVGDSPRVAMHALSSRNIDTTAVLDKQNRLMSTFGLSDLIPATVIIGKDGKIHEVIQGVPPGHGGLEGANKFIGGPIRRLLNGEDLASSKLDGWD